MRCRSHRTAADKLMPQHLQLRGDPLPNDAVIVVRAGTLDADRVRRTATANREDFGFFGAGHALIEVVGDQRLEALTGAGLLIAAITQRTGDGTSGCGNICFCDSPS